MTFEKIISYYFEEFLAENKYFNCSKGIYGRITNKEIFQFINFDKGKSGFNWILVNFTALPLYEKKTPRFLKHIGMKPGHGIDYFFQDRPDLRWFEYDSEMKLENSVATIKNILKENVFPWMEKHYSVDQIVPLYEDKYLRPPDSGWRLISLGFNFIRQNKILKTKDLFLQGLSDGFRFPEMEEICRGSLIKLNAPDFDYLEFTNEIIKENIINFSLQNAPFLNK